MPTGWKHHHHKTTSSSRNPSAAEKPMMMAEDSSVDPFLLDFGTSVNVTEDLHSEIRAEIQEMEAKIQTGLQENQQESRVAGQLQQDLSHAHCEMRNLSRDATDRLDDANVHTSFINGLETTLQADLVASTGPLPGCRSPVSVLLMNDKDKNGDEPSTVPTPKESSNWPTKRNTNKQVLEEKKEIVKKLMTTLQQQSKVGEARHQEKEALLQEKRQIEQTIQTGGLEAILEQTKQKNEHAQVDVQNESQRQQHLKEKIQSVRNQCGEHAQQLADKTKEINAIRNQNASQQEILSKQVAEASAQLSKQKAILGDAKSRHVLIASRQEQAQQELQEYEEFCKTRNALKEKLQKEEQEHQELIQLMEQLTEEKEQVFQELEETTRSLENAERLHADVLQTKAKNDEKEASEYVPGQQELVQLAEEKERLASKIRDQHTEIDQMQVQEKETLASKRELQNQIAKELDALRQKGKEHENEIQARTAANKDSKEALEREIRENRDSAEKLRLAYETEIARLQELEKANQEKVQKALENAKAQAQHEIASQQRSLQIYQLGAKLIDNARETVKKLNEDGVIM
eukprot:scaffold13478_cov132-Cylindrotheca_fusiformis.AAC.6